MGNETTAIEAADKKALDRARRNPYYIARRYIRNGYIMASKQIEPESLLPLRPSVFHILLALCDGDLHGYGIMQEVAEHTAGQIRLGPGTLYGAIKRLLHDRLIVEVAERPDPELDDERRRYYRLTDFGQQVLKAEVRRISEMVSVAQRKRLIPKPRS
jgi:DNA-binding PadR family transcriptional regulator